MGDIILRAQNVGKRYQLGTTATVARKIKSMIRRRMNRPLEAHEADAQAREFWALKDVSFELERGCILGVIGRNGAGKSTLLKILSRITAPTTGEVQITGRISSLLEVGTGFQPELTGRENVFLNGSILGMSRPEIARKFDEIVAFSELEQFIDTPVKRYSSGMYMRLAFAVAAHLEPDILILDEVMAVGDSAFHRKCLGKMDEVAGIGRTVIVVSHNMPTILSLCSRCVLLDHGHLIREGPTAEVAAEYERRLNQSDSTANQMNVGERTGNGKARFTNIQVYSIDDAGQRAAGLICGGDFWIDLTITAEQDIPDSVVGVSIYASTNERVIDVGISAHGKSLSLSSGQKAKVTFHLHDVLLKPDVYRIETWIGKPKIEAFDWVKSAALFSVQPDQEANRLVQYSPGFYRCRFTEEIVVLGNSSAPSL